MLDDVVEVGLERAVGDDGDLEALAVVVGADLIEDVGQQLAALLHRVEAGRPEEQRGVGVGGEAEALLEFDLVAALALDERVGVVVVVEIGVGLRVERRVGGVEDAAGAAGVAFRPQFVADLAGDEVVAAVDHLAEEGGADGVDEVGGEDAAGEQVDRVVATGFLVVVRAGGSSRGAARSRRRRCRGPRCRRG